MYKAVRQSSAEFAAGVGLGKRDAYPCARYDYWLNKDMVSITASNSATSTVTAAGSAIGKILNPI